MKYTVEIKPSGLIFQSDGNILEDALAQSINLEHSCKNGECGICEATVINGEVLDQNENIVRTGSILTCCSKANSNIILAAQYYKELSDIKTITSPCKVSSFNWATDDILCVTFRLPPKTKLTYLSGQYVDLSFHGLKRSYSIANSVNENGEIELHIRKVEGGKMSSLLANDLKLNQLMRIEGPKGTFFVRKGHKPIIFIATGTGIAPVNAMVEKLVKNNTSRDMYIYWGMRYQRELYCDKINTLSAKYPNLHFIPVLSRDNEWTGSKGYVQDIVLSDFPSLLNYDVYACGSINMISDAKEKFTERGLDLKAFYSDAFIAST